MKKWLKKKEAMWEYGLSEKRLRTLRKNKQVTHRFEGKEFLYLSESLDSYADGNAVLVKVEIVEPQNGDGRLIELKKEVIRKEREFNLRNKKKNLEKETSNVQMVKTI